MTNSLGIFICSTYTDLSEERSGVVEAIQKAHHHQYSMELFGAHPNRPIETCLNEVRQSDVLIVIVGYLYGSIVPELEISYTEAEYNEGRRLGKPCLIYFRDDSVPVLPKHWEKDPNKITLLEKFKKKLKNEHTIGAFKNRNDLAVSVEIDLAKIADNVFQKNILHTEAHIAMIRQGVEKWNMWRVQNPEISPDLSDASFSEMDLSYFDLHQVNLSNSSLRGATLVWTNFAGAKMNGTKLSNAILGKAIFNSVDLSETKGLEDVYHQAPSTIGIDTLYKSKGNIPEVFLRGCGVPDQMIEYAKSLTGSPIEYYSCFISYSHKDEKFVMRLHNDLQAAGVRCWIAPVDMRIGQKIKLQIDEHIRIHDKLLLILSKHSVQSMWVEHEVEHALYLEKDRNNTVLFPLRTDNTVMESNTGWAGNIRRQRHIADFTQWEDHDAYLKAFERLLRDLRAG